MTWVLILTIFWGAPGTTEGAFARYRSEAVCKAQGKSLLGKVDGTTVKGKITGYRCERLGKVLAES